MSTNYFRIPTQKEMNERKEELLKKLKDLEITPSIIVNEMKSIEILGSSSKTSIWDNFKKNSSIHLGSRSNGWKFLWNFNNNVFYKDKESLINFIVSGGVVDDQGNEIEPYDFIRMAFDWCQPDGLDEDSYRRKHPRLYHDDYRQEEKNIDGLRVSPNTDFR
jgi:hypothetical protein